MTIKEFAESDEKWNKLMEVAPQSTVFHQIEWLRIMAKYTKTKLMLLVGLDGEEIFAALPLFYEEKYGGLLRKLSSPPYPTGDPYLGFVFPDSHRWNQSRWEHLLVNFQEQLEEYIRSKINPDSIFIATSPELTDVRPFLWSGYEAVPRFSYIGDIRDKDLTWDRFNKSTRRNILKAETSGAFIEEGGEREYDLVIDWMAERYREQNMAFDLSKGYLKELYERFHPTNLRVFLCNWDGEHVGGQVVLTYKNKYLFWLGGMRLKKEEIYPNFFLFWKLIEWGRERGLEYFDLLGANTSSISKFKSQFGFDLKVYFWLQKSNLRHRLASNMVKIFRQ
jgi:hypothetical protein